MARITFKGNEIHTNGSLPQVGAEAPDFKGVKNDLSELTLSDLRGKRVACIVVLVIVPVVGFQTEIAAFGQKVLDVEVADE